MAFDPRLQGPLHQPEREADLVAGAAVAWQVRPPRLVTIADARFMIGSQSGSVMSATSTSPGWNAAICVTSASTR